MGANIIDRFTQFQQGDEYAFRFFYEKHYHALCTCVLQILKNEDHMHDIVQEAFITLWKSRDTLESELHLKMFLYQVVRHRCLNIIKNLKIQEKYIQDYLLNIKEEDSFTNQIIEEEVHRLIIQEIKKLPEEQRRVVILHLEGKDNAEMATILHVSVNTIKTHKARARKTLKIKLDRLLFIIFFWGL